MSDKSALLGVIYVGTGYRYELANMYTRNWVSQQIPKQRDNN